MLRITGIVCSAILGCVLLASSLSAQTQNCAGPISLPTPTQPNIFTDEQEVYLGDAVAAYVQRNYRVIEDADVTAYLASIGDRLIKNLPINRLRFQFFLVDLPDANAFVLPGGRIYVSRKLIAAAQSEDELASVIAHELGHLVSHDAAIDTTRMMKEVLGVTSVGDRRDIFEKYNQLIENAARKPGAFKSGDREKGQMSADQAGMYALVAAGYDAGAMARFWDRTNETKGKKGSWFSELFGTTRPEEKRLREMVRLADTIPAACRQRIAAGRAEEFKQWQANVVSYTGFGRKELLHGVLSKQQLSPPLRSDVIHLRFSPDGNYILAQDDSGITVLSREPFAPLFRIDAPYETYFANFSPDSQNVVFYTDNLRVERWNIAEQSRLDTKEVVVRKGCLQTRLSPDGKLLACLGPDYDLNLINVDSGVSVWRKKEFYSPTYSDYILIWARTFILKADSSDLNLPLIEMHFSPSGRYFAAGGWDQDEYRTTHNGNVAEVVDITNFSKVSIPDSLKRLICGGFTFLDDERIAGINESNVKKSGVVKFPSGEVLYEVELWRKGMTAPTRGDYLLIRPIKNYPLGVLDFKQKTISKVNERAALDIYEPFFVAERRNGELGLYRMEKNEIVGSAVLSNQSLGRLRVVELSSQMKWLALSGNSRGGIWNLEKGESVLSLRNFQGGFVSDDGFFFADFPKYEEADRNVAKFNLATGDIVPGPKIEAPTAHQYGRYIFITKSAKSIEKEKQDFEAKNARDSGERADYAKNILIEMLDARTMQSLWSKSYPKEAPRVWISAINDSLALLWSVNSEHAKNEIKNDERLAQQQSRMAEKEGDYFLQILDAKTGNELGKLLIETGKGSFGLANVYAVADWVIVRDTQNRVLVYSLKTGEQRGRVFGHNATVSLAANLLCIENEMGKLTIYDLNTFEKLDELIFSSPISLVRFSADGRKLFVLASNQTYYVLDVSNSRPTSIGDR
jgi:WD40 repeat protein